MISRLSGEGECALCLLAAQVERVWLLGNRWRVVIVGVNDSLLRFVPDILILSYLLLSEFSIFPVGYLGRHLLVFLHLSEPSNRWKKNVP